MGGVRALTRKKAPLKGEMRELPSDNFLKLSLAITQNHLAWWSLF